MRGGPRPNAGRPLATIDNNAIDREFARLDALSRTRMLTIDESLQLQRLIKAIDTRTNWRRRHAKARTAQLTEARQ